MRHSVRLVLLLCVYLVLAILYSTHTPLFEAPDEYYHFAVTEYLARAGVMPPREIPSDLPWRQMTFHAPLYYRIGAALIAGIDTSDFFTAYPLNPHAQIGEPDAEENINFIAHTGDPLQNTGLAVRVVRAFSIFLGALTLTGVYLIARLAVPQSPSIPFVAVWVVLFNPQFLYLSGVVSNDNLVLALSTVSLAMLVHLIRQGIGWWSLLILAILLALASIAKSSGVALYPVVIAALLWVCWRDHVPVWKVLAYGLIGIAIWGIVAGSWYLDNWRTLGDPSASRAVAEATGLRGDTIHVIDELRGVFYSFWGMFGWFNIRAPQAFYECIGLLIFAAFVGIAFRLRKRHFERDNLAIGLTLIGFAIIFVGSWWSFNQWVQAGQGRLLFPVMGALASFMAFGLTARYVSIIAPFLLGGMAVFTLMFPFTLLQGAFAPHPRWTIDEWQPPQDMTLIAFREPWQTESCLNVWISPNAVTITPDALSISLVYEARCPISGYWSVFAHLSEQRWETCIVGDTSHIVSQEDTMPDGGRVPFPALSAGSVLEDTLTIPLPQEMTFTSSMHLQFGLYDAGGSFIRAFVDPEESHFTDEVTVGECAPELVNIALHLP